MSSPRLVILLFCYYIIAVAGRRIHIHHMLPLRGTSDWHGSNRRPAGKRVVYKTSFILVYINYYMFLSYSNMDRLLLRGIPSAESLCLINDGRRGRTPSVVGAVIFCRVVERPAIFLWSEVRDLGWVPI